MSEPRQPFSSLRSGAAVASLGPPQKPFSWVAQEERGGSNRLILAGELNLASRDQFAQALDHALSNSDRVIVDVGALTLIDSAGLSVFDQSDFAHQWAEVPA
jgi:STAS domain